MKRILVTGAGGSASYNYIQSLRKNSEKEEFYLVGADVSRYHIELSPLDNLYILPRLTDPSYLKKLNELIGKERIDFLHVQPDPEVDFIARHKDKIQARTLLPDIETIENCQNKHKTFELLNQHNVPVPESIQITTQTDVQKGIEEIVGKYGKAWVRAIRGAGSRASLPVVEWRHAQMWIDYWITMKDLSIQDFMVSEFLPGKEYAFQSFWIDGKLITSQARERVEYIFGNLTPSGQSSSPSVAVTVHNDEVNEIGTKAVRAIDPHATGIFCIDMKTDKNGNVKITEINAGRFYTTSYFFSEAGFNLPYIYTKYAIDRILPEEIPQYNVLEENLYWVRMIDMGYKMIGKNSWKSKKI